MITGDLQFGMPWEAYKQVSIIPTMGKRRLPQSGVHGGPPIKARVNYGRWIVDCECNGAEFAFEGGIFMCQSCFNAGHQHKYRRLIFPKNRKDVEMALLHRPEPNRNWYPGETVAKLKAENKAHKAELLEVS